MNKAIELVTNKQHGHVIGRNGSTKVFANRTQAEKVAAQFGGEVVRSLGNRFLVKVVKSD